MQVQEPTTAHLSVSLPLTLDGPFEITVEHSVVGIVVTERATLTRLGPEWDVPGVYLLLDRPDLVGRWGAYVGKAASRGLRSRLREHLKTRDHWYRAILIRRDSKKTLNSAEAGWLEGHLYDLLHASGQVQLHNGNRPQDDSISVEEQLGLRTYIPPVLHTLHILGHRLTATPTVAGRRVFDLRKSQRGKTTREASRPVVAASTPRARKTTPKGRKSTKTRSGVELIDLVREGLVPPGTVLVPASRAHTDTAVVNPDGSLQFRGTQREKVSNPAKELAGYEVNGWTFWRVETPQGKVSLDALRKRLQQQRAASASSPPQ
ncbi:hypothetical protein [Microbispora sp. H10836]|uniref:restriction system modified-DNA reader domain-containing protein n=1 Tax=Microbispora sp. H10836 TaxID=2729106 RepID=UPI00147482B2|nr:hypothetical protein [Microbispora sp. H10836]